MTRTFMRMKPTRIAVTAALVCGLSTWGLTSIAGAQSPTPNHTFINDSPPNENGGYPGYTVEVADYGCSDGPSLSQIESTANYYIGNQEPTWIAITLEWSPGEYTCNTESSIESLISSLISYLDAAHPTYAAKYWQGIMLDEEPWYVGTAAGQATSYSKVLSLNSWLTTEMLNATGITWWSNEIANAGGWWTQPEFDNLLTNSFPAPQVYNAFMVNAVAVAESSENLVTWNPNEPSPYDSESYVLGEVSGSPYSAYNSNGALCYWENEFS